MIHEQISLGGARAIGFGMANPASENCVAKGGKLEIVTAPNGDQSGVCVFPDGSRCGEWAFFSGDCAPASSVGGEHPAKSTSLAIGFVAGAALGAGIGSIWKTKGAVIGGTVGAIGGAVAGAISNKRNETQIATASDTVTSSLANPKYPIKYAAQAFQLAALPSTQGPVMLCSYVRFASLESPDLATAQGNLSKFRAEKETAPEDLYKLRGRRQIVRLVKRYFDPKTFVELPSDVLYESDQKFPVPVAPEPGIPCG